MFFSPEWLKDRNNPFQSGLVVGYADTAGVVYEED